MANIMIDQGCHALIADFGLLYIILNTTNPTVSSSFAMGGTTRWMSLEPFYPDQSGRKNTRPTTQSGCYASGMVIYEVLCGQAPFALFHYCTVRCVKVMEGECQGDRTEVHEPFVTDAESVLGNSTTMLAQCRRVLE